MNDPIVLFRIDLTKPVIAISEKGPPRGKIGKKIVLCHILKVILTFLKE